MVFSLEVVWLITPFLITLNLLECSVSNRGLLMSSLDNRYASDG